MCKDTKNTLFKCSFSLFFSTKHCFCLFSCKIMEKYAIFVSVCSVLHIIYIILHNHLTLSFFLKTPQTHVRFTKALPSLFLRTKVGAKSVQSRWGRGGASSLVRRKSGGRANFQTQRRKDAKTLSLIFLNTDRTD